MKLLRDTRTATVNWMADILWNTWCKKRRTEVNDEPKGEDNHASGAFCSTLLATNGKKILMSMDTNHHSCHIWLDFMVLASHRVVEKRVFTNIVWIGSLRTVLVVNIDPVLFSEFTFYLCADIATPGGGGVVCGRVSALLNVYFVFSCPCSAAARSSRPGLYGCF